LDANDPQYLVLFYEQSFDDPKAATATSALSANLLVKIARQLLDSKDPLESLFQKCVAPHPLYIPLYDARVRTLMPRWGGSGPEMVKFAESSADATHDAAGDALYAYIARVTYANEGEENFRSQYHFSWERIRKGNEDYFARFGATRYGRNRFCRMACIYNDAATAAKMFREIGDDWDHDTWSNEYEFGVWKKWAFGETPYPGPSELEAAIRDNNVSLVDQLIKKGVNVNTLSARGDSMLSIAYAQESPGIVQRLIEGDADPNAIPFHGWPALVDFVGDDSPDLMNTLLARGVNVNVQARDGFTPLTRAISVEKYDRAQQLLQRGADPNLAYDAIWTPLRMAVEKSYTPLIRDLLDHSANPNTNPDPLLGHPMLVLAAEKRNTEACSLLLEHGADPNAAGQDNWNALFAAADGGGNLQLAQLLIAKGADVSARQADGWSLFHMAVKSNARPILNLLVEKNPEGLKFVTKNGRNLLHQAAKEGRTELVKYLLGRNVIDINAVDTESGKTALAYATANGNQEIMKMLRDAGAKE